MTLLEQWAQTPAAKTLGWTLVHTLWQGAAIALALAAALWLLKSSRARYAAACATLLAVLAGFGLTFALLLPPAPLSGVTIRTPFFDPLAESYQTTHPAAWEGSAGKVADAVLPWLGPCWLLGIAVFHLRMLAGWRQARRLRDAGVCGAPAGWQRRLDGLRERIRLARPVALLESCLAETPVVIGHLRPVILTPIGLLAGMPAAQVEAILLHELAHVRRHDYLVNLLQACAESLLFYHPAAWWISGVIRQEREHCCDDFAAAVHPNRREYAEALVALEQSRCAASNAAPAASGGSLVKRVRRLIGPPHRPRLALTPALSLAVLTIAGVAVVAAWQAAPGGEATQPPLPAPYQRWLDEEVAFIIAPDERNAFRKLTGDAERDRFIEQFWERRDPTAGTPENEFRTEHYRRLGYADQRFLVPSGAAGRKTDRGRAYILWGPPDEIESHPAGVRYRRPPEQGGGWTETFPFEQWRYRWLEGVGADVILEFVDSTGTGDYRAVIDPLVKEVKPYAPGQFGGDVFYSTEPGARVAVEVMPDRRILVSAPIDFDAVEYLITGTVRSRDGRVEAVLERRVSLCRASPNQFGCLTQPLLQTYAQHRLSAGSYVFEVVVKDLSGPARKDYAINFRVN
ncbi:MAG: GWxTD domain-containing protein [Bryobacteraceae bacterium]|nr:GWxTD domain-containing protein [Bryobacteraceae bacterium]